MTSSDKKNNIKQIAKGTIWALIITMILVLVLAIFVNTIGLSASTIGIVSQIIKVLSIFVGVKIALRSVEKRGYLHGGTLGILYSVLGFFIFSLIDPSFSITVGLLTDLLFATVVGIATALLIKMGRKRYSYT